MRQGGIIPVEQTLRDRTKGIYFDDYLMGWLDVMKGKVSPTTFNSYAKCVRNSISPFFRERGTALSALRPADIEAYYEQLRERGVSNNTIIHHHANIRKALQDAVRKDLISFNPADRVERPRKEQYAVNCYTAEEANQLLRAVKGNKLELPITLSLFYGLRRSEVLGLRWGAIDFTNHTVSTATRSMSPP